MESAQLVLTASPHTPLARAGGAPAHTAGRHGQTDRTATLQRVCMAGGIAYIVLGWVASDADELTSLHAIQIK
jgi:hypothetical protein